MDEFRTPRSLIYQSKYVRPGGAGGAHVLTVSTINVAPGMNPLAGRMQDPTARVVSVRDTRAILQIETVAAQRADASTGGHDHHDGHSHAGSDELEFVPVRTLTWIERDGTAISVVGDAISADVLLRVARSVYHLSGPRGRS